jgi:hypothetical protein
MARRRARATASEHDAPLGPVRRRRVVIIGAMPLSPSVRRMWAQAGHMGWRPNHVVIGSRAGGFHSRTIDLTKEDI